MAQAPSRTVKTPEARLNEILDAAAALFAQKGYDATSIQDIIQAVGIAKGTFYHYFRSKLDLLDAVVERLTAQALEELTPVVDDPQIGALEKFRRLFLQGNLWKLRRRALILEVARVMYRPENAVFRERLTQASIQANAPLFARIIRQGVAEGVFQVADPEETAVIVLIMGQALAEAFAQALLQDKSDPALGARLARRLRAYQQGVERVLGAAPGTFQFLSLDMLAPWLEDAAP